MREAREGGEERGRKNEAGRKGRGLCIIMDTTCMCVRRGGEKKGKTPPFSIARSRGDLWSTSGGGLFISPTTPMATQVM